MARPPPIPLPRAWPVHTRSGALHALGLVRFALMHVRGWCADSRVARVRLAAERDIALCSAAQAREQARILHARLEAIDPSRRPHYPPEERLAILELRAAAGWTAAETARRFLVTVQTVASWMRRLDEQGPAALVRLPEPVNRFPDFVAAIVTALRATLPSLGKVRIAQIVARAGLHLAPSTVARMLKRKRPAPRPPSRAGRPATAATDKPVRTVTARRPQHVWHIDLSLLPAMSGWWVPWLPCSLVQRWPFCWWLCVVLDHFSRSVVAWRLFQKEPTAEQVCRLLDDARRAAGGAAKYTVTDQGVQFRDRFRVWCDMNDVTPRFGAIGKSGSIAIIERFFHALKDEMLRKLSIVPLRLPAMRREVAAYVLWYQTHRPHQSLGGRTPSEVRDGVVPARERGRVEPRARYPNTNPSARRVHGGLALRVDRVHGRAHLPVFELREAA